MNIILASNSPRRKELLAREGVEFRVIPSNYNEIENFGLTPEKYVEFLAFNKAKSVFDQHGGIVIGADTVVVLNGKILGKPTDEKDARLMLKALSASTHEVITGYSILSKERVIKGHDITKVTFKPLSDKQIIDYVNTGSPLDKAGAYGIQDGDFLVESIVGDYDNVVGLPVLKIKKLLTEFV